MLPPGTASSRVSRHASAFADVRNSEFVSVSREEYDQLVVTSQQYTSLCNNLIRGGVNNETIFLLSTTQPEDPTQAPASQPASSTHHPSPFNSSASSTSQHDRLTSRSSQSDYHGQHPNSPWNGVENGYEAEHLTKGRSAHRSEGTTRDEEHNERRTPARDAIRTVLLSNLAERTTHADITNVIRGGQLVDIFVRYKDRSATVSFLHEEDCKAFCDHVRRHDLYINQKRVEVSLHDRQYALVEHIARKIRLGATRNLVIKRCSVSHTEESVREDLEHIHNLVAVKVEFIGGDCFIRTNSVVCATFARTCMMSRLKYKGSRIEFDVDECAQPLDRLPVVKKRNFAEPLATKTNFANSMSNRFRLLEIEDE